MAHIKRPKAKHSFSSALLSRLLPYAIPPSVFLGILFISLPSIFCITHPIIFHLPHQSRSVFILSIFSSSRFVGNTLTFVYLKPFLGFSYSDSPLGFLHLRFLCCSIFSMVRLIFQLTSFIR